VDKDLSRSNGMVVPFYTAQLLFAFWFTE